MRRKKSAADSRSRGTARATARLYVASAGRPRLARGRSPHCCNGSGNSISAPDAALIVTHVRVSQRSSDAIAARNHQVWYSTGSNRVSAIVTLALSHAKVRCTAASKVPRFK